MNFEDSHDDQPSTLPKDTLQSIPINSNDLIPSFNPKSSTTAQQNYSPTSLKTLNKVQEHIIPNVSNYANDIPKLNLHSLNNMPFQIPTRAGTHSKTYFCSKGPISKFLNTSHDHKARHDKAYTEGDSKIFDNNILRNDLDVLSVPQLDGEQSPVRDDGPIRHGPNEGDHPDSSQLNLISRNNSSPTAFEGRNINNEANEGQGNRNNELGTFNQTSQDIPRPEEIPENNVQIDIPINIMSEAEVEAAQDWQYYLTMKGDYKLGVLQWSLILVVLACIMGSASLLGDAPSNITGIVLILYSLLHMYSLIKFFDQKKWRTRRGLNKVLKLMDWIFLTAYFFGCLINTQDHTITLTFFLVPAGIIIIILRVIYIRKLTSFLRTVLWVQLAILTSKVDRIADISWYFVFTIAFMLCLGFMVRVFYMMQSLRKMKELAKEFSDEISQRIARVRIIGLIWSILINSYSFLFAVFFYGLAQKLETGQNNTILGAVFVIAILYSLTLTCLSLKYRYEITRSIITRIISNDNEHIKMKETLQKELEVGISTKSGPRYLVKVSSTYYQVAKPDLAVKKAKVNKKQVKNFVCVTIEDLEKNKDEEEVDNDEEDNENSSQEEDLEVEEEEELEEEGIEENSQEDMTCVVCCERKANTVIMGCGHAGTCYKCALEMWKKEERCYICRQKISKLLKVDTSLDDERLTKVQLATTLNRNKRININESFQDILNEI